VGTARLVLYRSECLRTLIVGLDSYLFPQTTQSFRPSTFSCLIHTHDSEYLPQTDLSILGSCNNPMLALHCLLPLFLQPAQTSFFCHRRSSYFILTSQISSFQNLRKINCVYTFFVPLQHCDFLQCLSAVNTYPAIPASCYEEAAIRAHAEGLLACMFGVEGFVGR
jgi:hypothetical protein